MALDKTVFKTRTITAVIFAAVILIGLFYNGWVFTILFSIIAIGCLFEYNRLISKFLNFKLLFWVLGIFYTILPFMLLADLARTGGFYNQQADKSVMMSQFSYLFPCAIIFSIWINDTMAYVVGSFIGKTPLSAISPKKTWEGTIGGALLCVGCIALLAYFIPAAQHLGLKHWVAIAFICAVAGSLGDLFESKLKRMAGVKDSGNIMPGHGGFLDRFDSLLFATPVVWLYLYYAL